MNTLKITCTTNPDVIGIWEKADVEEEMRDLDIDITSSNEWVEYVIDHALADVVFPRSVYDAAINEDVLSIAFKTQDGDIIKIVKL